MAAEGFMLLYSLTLLQVYNGDGDAIMMLDDLDASRKAMAKSKDSAEGSDTFIEIILSFLGNPRTLFRKIGEEAFSIFASEIGSEGLQSLAEILDTEENLEGQKELFNQGDDEEDAKSDDDSEEDSEMGSDVEMVDSDVEMINDGAEDSNDEDESSDSDSSDSDSDSDDDEDEEEDDAELTQFNNLLQMTLGTAQANMDGDEDSDGSDMDDEAMMALDPQLSKIFKQRSQITNKKKDREDAKQNVINFKSRVLDLLAIYLEKQYSNPLTLELLLPLLRRTRASANKTLAEKTAKMLRVYFDTRSKHKAPLPRPDEVDTAWAILKGIHEEAKSGGGAKTHADVCSSASLHVVKVLVGLDREHYKGVVDVYAETQKGWFGEGKKAAALQPGLFTQFLNWSMSARR